MDDAERFLEQIIEYSQSIKPLLKATKGSETNLIEIGARAATYFEGEDNEKEKMPDLTDESVTVNCNAEGVRISETNAVDNVPSTSGLAKIFSNTTFTSTFEMFQAEDFKSTIETVVVGIAASNPGMSAFVSALACRPEWFHGINDLPVQHQHEHQLAGGTHC